jgi:hypothetical protein
MLSLRNSIKFLLFVVTYIGYTFLMYFAISLPLDNITTYRDDFKDCRKLYVYSIAFFVMYVADTLRFIIYVILSIMSMQLAPRFGNAIFLANCLAFTYGVALILTVDSSDCLREYDINGFLIISGIGLILSLLTYAYNRLPHLMETQTASPDEYYLMGNHV